MVEGATSRAHRQTATRAVSATRVERSRASRSTAYLIAWSPVRGTRSRSGGRSPSSHTRCSSSSSMRPVHTRRWSSIRRWSRPLRGASRVPMHHPPFMSSMQARAGSWASKTAAPAKSASRSRFRTPRASSSRSVPYARTAPGPPMVMARAMFASRSANRRKTPAAAPVEAVAAYWSSALRSPSPLVAAAYRNSRPTSAVSSSASTRSSPTNAR